METNSICHKFLGFKTAARIDIQCEIATLSFDDISKAAPGEHSPTLTAQSACSRPTSPRPSATATWIEATGQREGYNEYFESLNKTNRAEGIK